MEFLIKRLYGTVSMSLIAVLIEEQGEAAAGKNEQYKLVLQRIYESNDLDQCHLICAEFLGYEDAAQRLREWIAKKKSRNA